MTNALELLTQYRNAESQRQNQRALAELAQQKFAMEQQMVPGQLEGQRLSNLGKVAQLQQMPQELAMKQALMARQQQHENSLMDFQKQRLELQRKGMEARANAAGKAPVGYRYKPDGSMEPIPGGPADLKAQAEQQKKATGAEDVGVALATLRDAYKRLEEGGGITSTDNPTRKNLQAAISSSGVGQAVGKAVGTQNQSARNDIAMARPALLASLMKATGMSAKQMDSNAELKLWLSTATDPTLDIQANRRALDNIERKYLSNSGAPKQDEQPAPPSKPSAAPKIGAVEDGHIFLGGNPADPSRWKKVGK